MSVHGLLHGLRPEAVGGRVVWDDLLPARGQVAQADLGPVDAQGARAGVDVRLHGPVDLGRAEAAEGTGRRGVGEDGARGDAHVGHLVGTGRGVLALGHHALGDVGVGAQQVVAADVLEDEPAVAVEAAAHADLGRDAAAGLEGLVEGEHQAHRAPGLERHERHQRLELDVLLAAEAAAGIRRVDPHLGQGQVRAAGHQLLQQVGMLDGGPDRDAVLVGRGREARAARWRSA